MNGEDRTGAVNLDEKVLHPYFTNFPVKHSLLFNCEYRQLLSTCDVGISESYPNYYDGSPCLPLPHIYGTYRPPLDLLFKNVQEVYIASYHKSVFY